jgi:hypothetical protein
MTTRHDAIQRALAAATETMQAKGEVEPMIIVHAGDTFFAVTLWATCCIHPRPRTLRPA